MILKLKHHFDAAHRLEFHKGLCFNLHGHRWEVGIEIEVEIMPFDKDMIVDFSDLKNVIDKYDHSTILKNCEENNELIKVLKKEKLRLNLISYSPTAENLSKLIYSDISAMLRKNKSHYQDFGKIEVKVKVFESPGAMIEF